MNEIEVIWKFLDNLDEYVYATDIETDELVYMNRKLLEVYGLQSIRGTREEAYRNCDQDEGLRGAAEIFCSLWYVQ